MKADSVYFERYDRSKHSALELFERCREWVVDTGAICPSSRIISSMDDKMKRLSADRFNLVIVGEFSSGKSYFINVLLDRVFRTKMKSGKFKVRGMLPDKISPATSTITIIRYGADESARVTYRDGRSDSIQLRELEEYVAESAHADRYLDSTLGSSDAKPASAVKAVEISCDSAWLQNGISVIDTPGIGSIHREHAEVTTSFIPQADAVIFMFGVQPPINNEAKLFLSQCVFHVGRFFFVQTMKDHEFVQDRDGKWCYKTQNGRRTYDVATQQNTAILADVFGEEPKVFGISSRWVANHRLDMVCPDPELSGFPQLVEALEQFLVESRGLADIAHHSGQISEMIASVQAKLAAMEAQSGKSMEEVELQIAAQEPLVREVKRHAENLRQMISEDLDAVIQGVTGNVDDVVGSISGRLAEKVNGMSLAELRDAPTTLSFYCQQELNARISRKSYDEVRPAFRALRSRLLSEGAALQDSVAELAGMSGSVSNAASELARIDVFHVPVPDTEQIQNRMATSVSTTFNTKVGWLLEGVSKIPLINRLATWFGQDQIESAKKEIVKSLLPVFRQVTEDLFASYREFLSTESETAREQVTAAVDQVIEQYDGSLQTLRNKLSDARAETQERLKGIGELRKQGCELRDQCEKLLADCSTRNSSPIVQ